MALIKCPSCNQDVSDMASECVHCGRNLKTSEIKCPECSHMVSSSDISCSNCGYPLKNEGDAEVNTSQVDKSLFTQD